MTTSFSGRNVEYRWKIFENNFKKCNASLFHFSKKKKESCDLNNPQINDKINPVGGIVLKLLRKLVKNQCFHKVAHVIAKTNGIMRHLTNN